jgi:methylenetetrahydrofolate reductase (NADPH)
MNMMQRAAQPVSVPTQPRLAELLSRASIEVTARDAAVADRLKPDFPRGIDVHVTFLPNDDYRQVEETCARLRQTGFNPVPHLTARNFVSIEALDTHLARLSEMADVGRALVISGDVDRVKGPFTCSLDILQTGLLQKHGIKSVLVAGHPEGHPAVTEEVMRAALGEKFAYARQAGLDIQIVTQFCFDPEGILNWLARIRRCGIDAPVRIGVAGPASTASLVKFAMQCGIGNSLRALRTRGAALGKLMGETKPDALLRSLEEGWQNPDVGAVSGIHFYMFGGAGKTAKWLAEFVKSLETETAIASARDRATS